MKQISFTIVRSNAPCSFCQNLKRWSGDQGVQQKDPMDANESYDKTDTHFNPI